MVLLLHPPNQVQHKCLKSDFGAFPLEHLVGLYQSCLMNSCPENVCACVCVLCVYVCVCVCEFMCVCIDV